MVNVTEEGLIAQTFAVSNEGMVGIAAFLGGYFLPGFTVVQTDCIAISISTDIFKQKFACSADLRRILLLYTQALFSQVSQNVFCSCHHTIEQRLARWLLFCRERTSTKNLFFTQETLADLLGVRRSSLSIVANDLRQKNLIDYGRGRITIQNPVALSKVACECDRLVSAEYSRLFDS